LGSSYWNDTRFPTSFGDTRFCRVGTGATVPGRPLSLKR
jgi:hypothetical protein